MTNVTKSERLEIVSDDLDLGSAREESDGEEHQEKVDVAQLPCKDLAVLIHQNGRLLGDLVDNEVVRIKNRCNKAGDTGREQNQLRPRGS